ncbi:MAG TPA: tRNA (adenosine(37)-N6)-threonylcarbamoyltransferase complex dimerization subunit type 1 TsaB [Methylomirabilota bacterium]|nr:tRNA (adenosine(37)-N6)-threonylcarbamoyltransferase complex dimerization subunit type 1 TsaB [Methylomirabilota bacterium]
MASDSFSLFRSDAFNLSLTPMLVLGIDTATRIASVGLIADEQVLAEASSPTGTNHTETLLPLIVQLLERANVRLPAIQGLGVSIGPGSFTGLRIALGTVKGLAYALGQKVAGVSTLEALARTVTGWEGDVCPILDARKGEVYTARFQRDRDGNVARISPDQVVAPQTFFSALGAPCLFLGDGIERYGELLQRQCGPGARFLPFSSYHPRGSVVALMAWERFHLGASDDIAALAPSYLRKPEAEFKRGGAGEPLERQEGSPSWRTGQ